MTARTLETGGRTARFVKAIYVEARQGSESAIAFARNILGEPDLAKALEAMMLKTGVPSLATTDGGWTLEGPMELRTMLASATVLGRFGSGSVPLYARVPFQTRFAAEQTGASSYWVGGGKPIPVIHFTMQGFTLPGLKLAAIAVLPDELLRATGPASEAAITRSVVRSAARQEDIRLLDPSLAADPDVAPASITNGVTPVATSTGNPAQDVAAMVNAATLDLVDAVLIMSPANAVFISAFYNLPGLGVRGGVFAGLPVLTSAAAADNLILVHGSALAVADDGDIGIDSSKAASIEMADDPTNDSVTPTGASMVSMFQTDSVAIRIIRRINWAITNPAGVLMVSGADYAGLGS